MLARDVHTGRNGWAPLLRRGVVLDGRRLASLERAGIHAVFALQDLADADSYSLQHSIDVTAVGLLVGRRLLWDSGWVDHRGERRYDKIDRRLV